MIETEFFERVNKYSAWNIWRMVQVRAEGPLRVDRWDHAMRTWESSQAIPNDMMDRSVFRPITLERVHFLQRMGI